MFSWIDLFQALKVRVDLKPNFLVPNRKSWAREQLDVTVDIRIRYGTSNHPDTDYHSFGKLRRFLAHFDPFHWPSKSVNYGYSFT